MRERDPAAQSLLGSFIIIFSFFPPQLVVVRLSAEARVFTRFSSLQPLESALSKGNLLFIALCGGMQGRKEEGKTMVSMATVLKKKATLSLAATATT